MTYTDNLAYNLEGLDVYSNVEVFMSSKKIISGSKSTQKAYRSDIKNFFNWKGIEAETYTDLVKLTKYDLKLNVNEILNYQIHLKDEVGNSAQTINRKIGTVNNLYTFLLSRGFVTQEDVNAFADLPKLKGSTESYGAATIDELEEWVKYIRNKKTRGRQKNLTKSNIMEFTVQTGYRLSSILELNLNDFVMEDDRVNVYADKTKGGKSEVRPISKDFYNRLLEMYELEGNGDGKMFNISAGGIDLMMQDIRNTFNISSKRNIVFHSLRKCGGTHVYKHSGNDLTIASDFLGHSDTKVTELYLDTKTNEDMGYITMRERTDMDLFKEVSHEDLIAALDGLDLATKLKLNTLLKNK